MKRVLPVLACLGLVALTGWLFHHATAGRFLAFDDDYNITLNPHLGALNRATAGWALTDTSYARRYLPLGWLSFSALVTGYGFDARAFHLASLGLHAVNGLLLMLLLWQVTGGAGPSACGVRARGGAIFILAAWWLWHPLRVEAVAWSSALLYVAATTWMLLAAVLFVAGLRGRPAWLWLAHAAYAGSLLTYGIWLGAPVALALLGFACLRQRGVAARAAWQQTGRAVWPAVVLAIAVALVNLLARTGAGTQWGDQITWQPAAVVAAAARALATVGWFGWKIIWPARLTPADDMWADEGAHAGLLLAGLGFLLFAGLGAMLWRRRAGVLPLLVLLAFIAVELPLAGLTEQDFMVSDRYTYTGQIILVVALAGWLVRLRPVATTLALGLLGALTVAGAVRAWRQIPVWQDSDHLLQHLVGAARRESTREFYRDLRRCTLVSAGRAAAVEAELRAGAPASDRLRVVQAEAARVQREAAVWEAENTVEANLHHEFARQAWARQDRRWALAHLAYAVNLTPRNWPAWADYAVALWQAGYQDDARRAARMIPATGRAAVCRERAGQVVGVAGPGN